MCYAQNASGLLFLPGRSMVGEQMEKTTAVIIGGGATGVGILRDLSMRGVAAILLEQRDLAYGASSRFHGLLHSGGRYAVKDPEAARECAVENAVLRKIGRHCVESTTGYFVRLPEDDPAYEPKWVIACQAAFSGGFFIPASGGNRVKVV